MQPTSTPRHHRRRLAGVALGLGLGAMALAAGACTDDADWAAAPLGEPIAATTGSAPPVAPAAVTPPSWLFAIDSPTADSVDTAAGFTVTLAEPGHVLAFTDRPARDAHRLRTAWLAQNWDLLFAEDPPNGVLTGLDPDGRAVEIAVEIEGLTGDGDELVASVRGLGEDADTTSPGRMTDVALFIDDVVVPTTSQDWSYHSVLPSGTAEDSYIARQRVNDSDIGSEGNFIYSFPATALIEGYSDHHLDLAGQGIELHGVADGSL